MMSPESVLLRAEALLDDRRLEEAVEAFDHAERSGADPDGCSAGRWTAWMLMGRFAQAWRESDAIRRRGAADPNRCWNGEDWQGKRVMVRCLHGYGDAIQFLRYVPLLRKQAAQVTVEVAPHMVEIAEMLDGVEDVITWGERAPVHPPEWDVQVEVTELPYVFRTEVKDLPLATQYIHLPQPMLRSAARRVYGTERTRVGVAWSCGEWNLARSVPLALLRPLFGDKRFEFWNLQGGTARREWPAAAEYRNVYDAPEFCDDAGLLPLACFMAQMDLILTVDTLAAHLGGALGIPTWLLLRYDADWRWMTERSDSPWYPSLRLFRQGRERTWEPVVERVKQQLAQWDCATAADKAVA